MKKNNYHDFFVDIWGLGDEIIEMCGIDNHITDIYLATINDFVDNEKHGEKVVKKLNKKYNLSRISEDTPIALIALNILENRCDCIKE